MGAPSGTNYPPSSTCSINFTYCLADAGHRWFGSTYDESAVCQYQGYAPSECDWEADHVAYGPNTLSVSVAMQALDFFANAGARVYRKLGMDLSPTVASAVSAEPS
jgi:hypothetical protein